jgi:Xaa-Pro aminopeptidase
MRLGEDFYRRKVKAVQEALEVKKLAGLVTFQYAEIYYLAGFFHYPTERPVALFIPRRGDPVLFIPRLELDYVREGGWAPEVESYFEYPGSTHPVDWICERLKTRGWDTAALGWEDSLSVGTRERLGRALPHVSWIPAGDIVSRLRLTKEPEEIALMRRAAQYADWMLEEGVRMVRTGERYSEIEIQQAMVSGVIKKMERELDPVVAVPGLAGALVCSGLRSAFPHGLPTSRRIGAGENLILSVACFVGGYFAESERTFILGEPTPQQRQRYETDRHAQEIGTQGLVPGARCADVNRRCLDVIRDAGLGEYLRHRQGHGIGLQNHEPPWIEDGDPTILQPGIAVSCEPGIYCPGQGGYRISDSVVVTTGGPEQLTQYPRDFGSIVISI